MRSLALAQDVAPEGIRVNAIAPGANRTRINRPAWKSKPAYEWLMRLVPYGRIGEPEVVARAAVWLASDASLYVVGTTLFIAGGMTLYPGASPATAERARGMVARRSVARPAYQAWPGWRPC
jgi:glucose 1-dehydrogenase